MTNYVCFSNPGEIDPRVIGLMGVNVKPGTASPIGFFGTGLKYALAVGLREGMEFVCFAGETRIDFELRTEEIRGKEFQTIWMREEDEPPLRLGFTTELGKDWLPWMVYRELHCNALDECGQTLVATGFEPEVGQTKIYVTGLESVHADRSKYFLQSNPISVGSELDIHSGSSDSIFYKGVKVGEFGGGIESRFTYNLHYPVGLSEDRTLSDWWTAKMKVAQFWAQCDLGEDETREVVEESSRWEKLLDFDSYSVNPGQLFSKVAGESYRKNPTLLNPSVRQKMESELRKNFQPQAVSLSQVQEKMAQKALAFLSVLGHPVTAEVVWVETLGPLVQGLARDGKIFIAQETFGRGTKWLTSTLLEEHLHLTLGYYDCTRELQNWLFDKVVSLGEEIQGEPL